MQTNQKSKEEIEWAYEQMRKKRVLGSQRALQFGGSPIFKHNARMYNCIVSVIELGSFKSVCTYFFAGAVQVLAYKNTT